MPRDASELARRLARDAERVCRHYLSQGRRQGRYWTVGDVRNTPGRSMFVRLRGPDSGRGAAGRWTDAASAEHGDLLDVIRESCGLVEFRDVAEEARRFLALPRAEPRPAPRPPAPQGSPEAARRLWAMAKPLAGTLAEAYLHARGITTVHHVGALRFHPRCWYRPNEHAPTETWPAMIAAVTDLSGAITGVHRTWLARSGLGKAPIDTPRRALGGLLGRAVRFGTVGDVLAAGEGIETMLSLRCVLPAMPMAAALSATVTIERATSLEEACARAIEEANQSDGWKSIDHCGPTFVAAIAPGNVDSPWCRETFGSVLPVPDPYVEGGEAAVAACESIAFVERVAAYMRRREDRPGRRRVRRDRADRLDLLDALVAEAKAIQDRHKLPSAPGRA